MNIKRIGRLAVCLMLVCCLIVNISPIRAQASATATAAIVGVSAVTVACSLMLGCGVLPGSDVNIFTDVANTVATNLESSGWVTDGMIDVYKLNDVAYTYGVPQGIIDETRNFLWQNNYILSGFDFPDDLVNPSAFEIALSYCEDFSLCVFWVKSDGTYRFVGGSSFDIEPYSAGGLTIRHTSGLQYRYWDVTSSTGTPAKKTTNSTFVIPGSYQVCSDGVWGSITVAEGLVSGEIAPQSSTFADGYSTWAGNSVTIPGTAGDGSDDVVVVPAGNLSLEDVTTQSQEDIWNGTLVEDDETEDVPIVPPADGLTGSLSDTNAGTFLDSIFAFFTSLFAPVTDFFENFWAFAEYLIECLEITLADKIEAVTTAVASISAAFSSWLEKILEWLSKIWDVISSIPGAIATAISDVLVWAFAISDTFIATKVNELIAKYSYLEPMLTLGENLKVYFTGLGIEPPIIYIDLGAAEGSYVWGGKQVFIDLTWYSRYKPTVDTIIAAFLWLWAAWRFFLSLPGIIQGNSGIWGSSDTAPDFSFHSPKYQVGRNWLNSGSSYHRSGDGSSKKE